MSLFKRAFVCMIALSLVILPSTGFASETRPISYNEFRKLLVDFGAAGSFQDPNNPEVEFKMYLPDNVNLGQDITFSSQLIKDKNGNEEIGVFIRITPEAIASLNTFKQMVADLKKNKSIGELVDLKRSHVQSTIIALKQYNPKDKKLKLKWAIVKDTDLNGNVVVSSTDMKIIFTPKDVQDAALADKRAKEEKELKARQRKADIKRVEKLMKDNAQICSVNSGIENLEGFIKFETAHSNLDEVARFIDRSDLETTIDLDKEREKINNKREQALRRFIKKRVSELRKEAKSVEDAESIATVRSNIEEFLNEINSEDLDEKAIRFIRGELFPAWMYLGESYAYFGDVDSAQDHYETTQAVFEELSKKQRKRIAHNIEELTNAEKEFEFRQVHELAKQGLRQNPDFQYAYQDILEKYQDEAEEACDYGPYRDVNVHTTGRSFLGLRPYRYTAKNKFKRPVRGQVERCEAAKRDVAQIQNFVRVADQADHMRYQYMMQQQQMIQNGQRPYIPQSAAPWAVAPGAQLPGMNTSSITAPGMQFPNNAAAWGQPQAVAPQQPRPFHLGAQPQQHPLMQQQMHHPMMQQQPHMMMQQPQLHPLMMQNPSIQAPWLQQPGQMPMMQPQMMHPPFA